MKISAAEVNRLRKQTGAGMMDCKKALIESNGDFEAAIDYLRKKGQKVAAKRADRDATEGVVVAVTNNDGNKGVVVHVSCETDFVAKNEDFISFSKDVAGAALNAYPQNKEDLLNTDLGGKTIETHLTEQVGKIGEKIEVKKYETLESALVVPYIHAGYKIGVLVGLNERVDSGLGKDVAMQIAALNPLAVNENGIEASVVEKEREIGREQALAEGKPEQIVDKIAEGKVKKFFKENTLLSQQFVKDGNKTVGQFLKDSSPSLEVTSFKRVALG